MTNDENIDDLYEVIVNADVIILRTNSLSEAVKVYDEQYKRLSGQTGRHPGGTVVLVKNDEIIYEFSAYKKDTDGNDQPPKKSDTSADIERRVAISIVIGRYLTSSKQFNEASYEFTAACKALRKQLGANHRSVTQVDGQTYLVTTDRDGNFDVESIQSF